MCDLFSCIYQAMKGYELRMGLCMHICYFIVMSTLYSVVDLYLPFFSSRYGTSMGSDAQLCSAFPVLITYLMHGICSNLAC